MGGAGGGGDESPRVGGSSATGGTGVPALRRFDCVLMDVVMKRTNGAFVTRDLRLQGATLPIYAMTANTAAGDVAFYVSCGMSDFVVGKPFSADLLRRTMALTMAAMRTVAPESGSSARDRAGATTPQAVHGGGAAPSSASVHTARAPLAPGAIAINIVPDRTPAAT